jgi:1,4-dihydroxy-2-naphthoate octaprenyltransferase
LRARGNTIKIKAKVKVKAKDKIFLYLNLILNLVQTLRALVMEKVIPGSLKAWLLLPRFQFLPLTVILVSLGTAIAAYEGFFHLGYFFLALIGSILVHITVNVINDYYDYVDGIDLNTQRTPFSGGSGVLPSNLLKPSQAKHSGSHRLGNGHLRMEGGQRGIEIS